MGLELKDCSAEIKGEFYHGRLHVDSKNLEFKNSELSWAVPVGKGTRVKIEGTQLTVSRGRKSAIFSIEEKLEKWADKILHPPTLGTKLGLKTGLRYWVRGELDPGLSEELDQVGLEPAKGPKSCELVFVFLNSQPDLKKLDAALKSVKTKTHVWAIWPKGTKEIPQSAVIAEARKHGIGPGKGIAFDDVRSAMRFTKK